MGYRSDIAIAMYAYDDEDVPVLNVWFDQFRAGIKEHEFHDNFSYADCGVLFYAEGFKWYDGYQDVKFVEGILEKFIELFQSEDTITKYNYEYIRIGEDTGDMEERCGDGGFDKLSTNRSIGIHF